MKLSELIAKAQEAQKKYGDIEVLSMDFKGEFKNAYDLLLTAYRSFEGGETLIPSGYETKLPTVNRLAIMII